jgi:hypothetical protein
MHYDTKQPVFKAADTIKKIPQVKVSQTVDKLDENRACLQSFLFACEWGLLISVPGASLSAGRAVSLLVAVAPAGSHLSR